MKKLLLLHGLIFCFVLPAISQNHESSHLNGYDSNEMKYKLEPDSKKNTLKLDPVKLILGGINLSYERVLTRRTSINFRAKFHPLGFVERTIDGFSVSGSDYTFKITDRPRFHHLGFDAEYRFYVSNKYKTQGFYVAPYLRYLNYAGNMESNYTGAIGGSPVNIDGSIKTTLNSWGIGLQTGVQWRINNKISIDWGIAGLGIDRYVFGVNIMSPNIEDSVDKYMSDLQNMVGGVSGFLLRKLALKTIDNGLSSSVPFWLIGWKSFLTVGIAF